MSSDENAQKLITLWDQFLAIRIKPPGNRASFIHDDATEEHLKELLEKCPHGLLSEIMNIPGHNLSLEFIIGYNAIKVVPTNISLEAWLRVRKGEIWPNIDVIVRSVKVYQHSGNLI